MARLNDHRVMLPAVLVMFATACGSSNGQTAVNNPPGSDGGAASANGTAGSGATAAGSGNSNATAGSGSNTGGANNSPGGSSGIGGLFDNGGPSVTCNDSFTLPANAPKLTVGQWVEINPPGFPFDKDTSSLGLAVHPCNPAILYLCTGSFDTAVGGLFRSDDAGANWKRVANVENINGSDHLEAPLHVAIDPKNKEHVYVVQGVRGRNGFFVSYDGGNHLTIPQSFKDLKEKQNIGVNDVYWIAVDPTDFNHFLLTFHSAWGWTDTKYHESSGVLESTDGGESWIVHDPQPTWGSGHSVAFLFDPELGIGDAKTWLVGTQTDGRWRTDDAGKTWKKVTDVCIQHGGGTVYYDQKNKALYAAGNPTLQRSMNNGIDWEPIGTTGGFSAIFGDGVNIYTAPNFGPTSYSISAEGDGKNWAPMNGQMFEQGPFEFAIDKHNNIVYASNWGAGLWALKTK